MEVVWCREERKSRRGGLKRSVTTDDIMSRAVELRLEVDDGERHAEKVQGVASPGQPAKNGSKLRSKLNQPRRGAKRADSPREKETPLGESDGFEDFQQRPRSLDLLSLWHKISQEVGCHGRGVKEGGGTQRDPKTPRWNRSCPCFPPLSKAHELLGMVLFTPGWIIVGREA